VKKWSKFVVRLVDVIQLELVRRDGGMVDFPVDVLVKEARGLQPFIA
jgi:hypothetical protein